MTLKQILESAIAKQAEDRTAEEEAVCAAYWAGLELGRGSLSRAVNENLRAAKKCAQSQRYHNVALKPLECFNALASDNDDSEEILSWEIRGFK